MRRGTGRKLLIGGLVILLLVLVGTAGWMLAMGETGYEQWEPASASGPEEETPEPVSGKETEGENNPDTEGEAAEESGKEERKTVALETEEIGPGYGAGETEEKEEEKEIVLLFGGDVYLSDHVLNAYDKAGGIQGVLDDAIRDEISRADIFMVNQEFPFTERGTAAQDKQFTFRLPMSRLHLMNEMGIDIVTMANNHILDFGQEGLLDSCTALDSAGIRYVGAGPDLERARKLEIIEVGGKTIGFLGTSRVYMDGSWAAGAGHPGVFSTYDSRRAVESIRAARELCDYLVVYVHWGVERETTPREYQKVMGHEYIDAGADLVVGSHPHVLQPMEEYQGKTIVYSLGNFVFGSSIPETALLKVTLDGEEVRTEMLPCTSSAGYTRMVK